MMPRMQSAYRRHHATETALRVVSDILRSTDEGKVTLLGPLEVSAAFNTVNQTILQDRMRGLLSELRLWL